MDFTSEFFPAFIIYLGILLTITAFKGFQYDQLKREKNANYKKRHSAFIMQGLFVAVIPFPIKDDTKDPRTKKNVKQYNRLTMIFWISILILILAYIILDG